VWVARRETIRGFLANQLLEEALEGIDDGMASQKYSLVDDKDNLRHTLSSLAKEPALEAGGLIISC